MSPPRFRLKATPFLHPGPRLLALCLLAALTSLACAAPPLAGHQETPGIIDLRDWNPAAGAARIDGVWLAWPGQLADPQTAASEPAALAVPAPVPSLWSAIPGAPAPFGLMTYRVRLLVKPGIADQLCLQLGDITGASRLWVDGNLRAETGRLAATPQAYQAAQSRGLAALPVRGDHIDLVLQMANFSERIPGILGTMLIGTTAELSQLQERLLIQDMFLVSGLIVLSVFIMLFFFFRSRELPLLYLSLFAMLIGCRHFFLGSRLIHTVLPGLSWEFTEKWHYCCYYLAVAVFIQLLTETFPRRGRRAVSLLSWCAAAGFTVLTLATDKATYESVAFIFHGLSFVLIAFCVYLLVRAVADRQADAVIFLVATCLIFLGALFDTVSFYFPVNQFNLTAPLVLLFLFIQAIRLSWRFNADFTLSRNLTDELRRILHRQDQIHEGLERTVIERTQALRKALDEATVANGAKTEFLANISHEIRTPLNAIIGLCELMIDSHRNSGSDSVRLILVEATRLLQLMNQLLDVSKIEAKRLELENHPFDLREMFATVETTMNLRTVASDVRFSLHLDPTVPRYVRGDPLRLRQILDNLLGNALKFTDAGSISVSARARETPDRRIELRCEIADTGIGIPPEQQKTIFETFRQADTSTTRIYGGTGLGTSISRSMVELMGGTISLESAPGQGSCFRFSVLLEAANADEVPGLHLHDHQTEPFWQTAPRVLLVEDYLLNAEIIARHLVNAGWEVSMAANGQLAVEAFFRDTFDLVLMDIHMPVLDGLEATRQIRQHDQRRVPIIGLSASAFKEDHERCLQAGMNELVAKPVRRLKLLETLASFVPPGSYVENSTSHLNQAVARLLPADSQVLMKDLDGDLALFLQMTVGFVRESSLQLARLRQAIEHDDGPSVHRLAHTIKGGALNLGAGLISATALELEQAAKQGEKVRWRALFADLESQVKSLEALLSRN